MEEFLEFLKEEKVIEKFINKLKKECKDLETYVKLNKANNYKELVSSAFNWGKTAEEHFYWKHINDKWMNKIKEKDENKIIIQKLINYDK